VVSEYPQTKKRCGYYATHLWHGRAHCLRCGIGRHLPPSQLARALGVSRQRVHQLLHGDKHLARAKVAKALATGLIGKLPFCYRWGLNTEELEAHHWDYNQPLHVGWFCIPCHNVVHPHVPTAPQAGELTEAPLQQAMTLPAVSSSTKRAQGRSTPGL
jgi:hypothetical protein